MRASTPILFATATLSLAFATPSHAGIGVTLAKECRSMMVHAHPTQMFGVSGSAALQRAYFHECVSRQGRMDQGAERTTTGSGSASDDLAPANGERRW